MVHFGGPWKIALRLISYPLTWPSVDHQVFGGPMVRKNRSAPPAHAAPPLHDPWTPHDFPGTTKPICRGCSYAIDGTPLTAVPYPCPEIQIHAPTVSGAKPASPPVRLAAAVRRRRVTLGLSQKQLASRAHLAVRTVHHVENASTETMRSRTESALEQALKWRPGSIQRTLDGGAPVELPEAYGLATPDVSVVLQSGLPAEVEATLVAHMTARRADMEAALESEARLLVEQSRTTMRAMRAADLQGIDW